MKIIKFSSAKWAKLALEYTPKKNFDRVMCDTFGLVRTHVKDDVLGHYYKIVDEAKYTFFLLRWS